MTVRAKFRVTRVEHWEGDTHTVYAVPVTTGSEENKAFFKYTPGGELKLSTVNAEAAAQFAPGKEIYLDFSPV